MSQPFERYLHPFDAAHHPAPEPEVRQAILASWASDRRDSKNHRARNRLHNINRPFWLDHASAPSRPSEGPDNQPTLQ